MRRALRAYPCGAGSLEPPATHTESSDVSTRDATSGQFIPSMWRAELVECVGDHVEAQRLLGNRSSSDEQCTGGLAEVLGEPPD
jgi:hypothetical protein